MPSQKDKVLALLKAAGSFGVRSDTYLAEHIPRAAARVRELREEGYEITSEREKQFVRYVLVGSTADTERPAGGRGVDERAPGLCGRASRQTVSSASSEASAPGIAPSRSVPSFFDLDSDWGTSHAA